MPSRRQPSIGFAFSFVISETGPVTGWWLVSTHESGWMAVTEHTRMTNMTPEQLLEAALDGKLDIDGGAIGDGGTGTPLEPVTDEVACAVDLLIDEELGGDL